MTSSITRIYPRFEQDIPLKGLYLGHSLRNQPRPQRTFIYTNYIVSLDGRIAVAGQTGKLVVPRALTNPRDWRLYQELAAQADILITSSRYIRQLAANTAQDSLPLGNDQLYADLHEWRRQQGLPAQPAVVIISGNERMPLAEVRDQLARPVYVAATADAAPRLQPELDALGIKLIVAGQGKNVDGEELVNQLAAEGHSFIYSIAGPRVFNTLLQAGMLDRLYLTRVHRLLGGASYSTLLEDNLPKPADFIMRELYYDACGIDGVGQTMEVYDVGTGEE